MGKSKHEVKNLEYGALFIIGLSRNKKDFFKRLNVHQPWLLIPPVFHSAFLTFKAGGELLIEGFQTDKAVVKVTLKRPVKHVKTS